MNRPIAHLSAGLPHSQPTKPVPMYHKHGGPIRRFSDTHHQVKEGLLGIQNRFQSLDGCFESFLSTFSTPNPGCAPVFDQAKERDIRQRFQQVKQTACDLQKDLEDLKTLDTQNLDGGEAYRRRLEVIRNRLAVLRTNNQELSALLRTLASRFGLSNVFNGLGAAGQSGGVTGAGGQSSQGGTGSQTGTGGSTGGAQAGGGTQSGGGDQAAGGSTQTGGQGASGSTQTGDQTSAGSSAGDQSAAGNTQTSDQSAAGNTQAGDQSAAGSSQTNGQSGAGSTQTDGQSGAGSTQTGGQSAAGTGTGATDGATQNASSGGSGVLLDINASSNPQSGTADAGATVSNGAGGDTSGTAGSPLIDISVNAP